MSQQIVEGILGRLITDEEFRDTFFRDPRGACDDVINELTAQEVAALAHLDREALGHLAAALDPKIVRAVAIERPVRSAA